MGNLTLQVASTNCNGNRSGYVLAWQDGIVTADTPAQVISSYQNRGLGKYLWVNNNGMGYTTMTDLSFIEIRHTYGIVVQATLGGTGVTELTQINICPK